MAKKENERRPLTPEEAARLEALLTKRIYVIRHTVLNILSPDFRYLVDDCVNEVLLLACKKAEILLCHENPGGWLVIASKYVAHKMRRKHLPEQRNVPIDELRDTLHSGTVFEDLVFEEWKKKKIPELLISRLTPREREIYDLLYIQKKTPKTVAEELHISVSTVRNIKKSIEDKIRYDVENHNFEDF